MARFVTGLQAQVCSHPETLVPDLTGRGICVRCGKIVRVFWTKAALEERLRRLRRSFA